MAKKSSIDTILVIPRNRRYASYFINGNEEEHAMPYDEMQEYLINLVPQEAKTIIEYIHSFFNFIVFVNYGVVERLIPEPKDQIVNLKKVQKKALSTKIQDKKKKMNKKSFSDKVYTFYKKMAKIKNPLIK